nr:Bs4C-R protein [Ipomoea batatas]
MQYIDVRHVVLLLINLSKSMFSSSSELDSPAMIIDLWHPSLPKLALLILLALTFAVTSVNIPLNCPINRAMHIRIDVGSFSTSLGLLFLGSLGLPQTLFWYVYMVVVLGSSCSSWLFDVFCSFLEWVRAIFSGIPSFRFVITVTYDGRIELEREVEDHVARQNWHPPV